MEKKRAKWDQMVGETLSYAFTFLRFPHDIAVRKVCRMWNRIHKRASSLCPLDVNNGSAAWHAYADRKQVINRVSFLPTSLVQPRCQRCELPPGPSCIDDIYANARPSHVQAVAPVRTVNMERVTSIEFTFLSDGMVTLPDGLSRLSLDMNFMARDRVFKAFTQHLLQHLTQLEWREAYINTSFGKMSQPTWPSLTHLKVYGIRIRDIPITDQILPCLSVLHLLCCDAVVSCSRLTTLIIALKEDSDVTFTDTCSLSSLTEVAINRPETINDHGKCLPYLYAHAAPSFLRLGAHTKDCSEHQSFWSNVTHLEVYYTAIEHVTTCLGKLKTLEIYRGAKIDVDWSSVGRITGPLHTIIVVYSDASNSRWTYRECPHDLDGTHKHLTTLPFLRHLYEQGL
jgi:hypothetical protein